MKTIFIFRRDLRIYDNKGLDYAMNNFKNIIPIFIFTPEQIINNKYKANNAVQFMIESLKDLDANLRKKNSKLHLYYGDNIEVLTKIMSKNNIENIVFNIDYTPYARKRDKQIYDFCLKKGVKCVMVEDYLLNKIGTLVKKDGNPYSIFTPFYNNAIKHKVDKPYATKIKNLIKIKNRQKYIKYEINKNILVNGGRKNGLFLLNKIKKHTKYNKNRNTLSIPTTHLSAYIKFGCLSIREVYWRIRITLSMKNDLIKQLYWREFYYYIVYYYPKMLKGQSFDKRNVKWIYNNKNYIRWCEGQTGYPIIDACMNELNITGHMHNRGRLITSNFLNRMLGMDWRLGELYFATKLIDYDPSVNNGNWQWIASVGVDTKPYNQRLFNPMLQSKKYDKETKYIKKWLPNLSNIPSKHLHNWNKYYENYDLHKIKYYEPIVDYKYARNRSIEMYRKN